MKPSDETQQPSAEVQAHLTDDEAATIRTYNRFVHNLYRVMANRDETFYVSAIDFAAATQAWLAASGGREPKSISLFGISKQLIVETEKP